MSANLENLPQLIDYLKTNYEFENQLIISNNFPDNKMFILGSLFG